MAVAEKTLPTGAQPQYWWNDQQNPLMGSSPLGVGEMGRESQGEVKPEKGKDDPRGISGLG